MGCGIKCAKFLLFSFNLLFWVLGLAVLGVGIYSRVQTKDFGSILGTGNSFASSANILIAAGVFVSIVGFCGCFGAMRQNKCALIMYMIMIVLIFVIEIVAGIFAYLKRDEVLQAIGTNLKEMISKTYKENAVTEADKGLKAAVDFTQKELLCCGYNGSADWIKNINWKSKTKVPGSCCGSKDVTCAIGDAYKKGCEPALQEFIKSKLVVIGGIGVGIGVIQLFGLIFAIMVYREADHDTLG